VPGTSEHITPSWLRARITAIRKLIEELPANRDETNSDRTLIRNGFIPESQQKRFNELLDYEYKLTFALNEPLTFTEVTSFNTWFVMHPEKICGKEVVTTSVQFPISVKGTKEVITRTIKEGLKESVQNNVHSVQKNVQDEQNNVHPEQNSNSTQTEFHNDTQHIDTESEKPANRFGSAKKVLGWEVNEFHSYYHDAMNEFEKVQSPLEQQNDELKKQLKEVGRDRTKRKELETKLNKVVSERNHNKYTFEGDWLDFCLELRNIIIEIGKNKGIHITAEEGWYIPDDILMAITDRPGTEYYWKTKISEVIEKEFEYFVKEQQKQDKAAGSNILELEALALETELQLLKI
jgi:cytochrome c556